MLTDTEMRLVLRNKVADNVGAMSDEELIRLAEVEGLGGYVADTWAETIALPVMKEVALRLGYRNRAVAGCAQELDDLRNV